MIDVARGLYILRYVSGGSSAVAPDAFARPAQGSAHCLQIMSQPGLVDGYLGAPGDCAIVRAEQDGKISLKIMRRDASVADDPTFRLDPVGAQAEGPAASAAPSNLAGVGAGLRVLAHLSRRGDVAANAGEWLGGPQAPALVEGVQILGDLPAGVGIEMQPLVATRPLRWLDWSAHGLYVGTRGRALPLAGLRLRLTGDARERFVLSAEALFLGSAIMAKRGREIELAAQAGDPLTGLRIELREESARASSGSLQTGFAAAPDEQAIQMRAPAVPPRSEPRVRVFRSAANA